MLAESPLSGGVASAQDSHEHLQASSPSGPGSQTKSPASQPLSLEGLFPSRLDKNRNSNHSLLQHGHRELDDFIRTATTSPLHIRGNSDTSKRLAECPVASFTPGPLHPAQGFSLQTLPPLQGAKGHV